MELLLDLADLSLIRSVSPDVPSHSRLESRGAPLRNATYIAMAAPARDEKPDQKTKLFFAFSYFFGKMIMVRRGIEAKVLHSSGHLIESLRRLNSDWRSRRCTG
jgi:hypothetical protein